MKFSEPKVLVIGNGKWAETIVKSLKNAQNGIHIGQIGARNFSSVDNQEILKNVSVIWVATLPQLQIEVLKKIIDTKSKVIIEKPVARNLEELEILIEVIKGSNCHLYLSALWNRSILWEKFLENSISKIEFINRIEIRRGSTLLRDSLNPIIDWLPHDLYLLTELFGEFKDISGFVSNDKRTANIYIKDLNGVNVKLEVGYFTGGRESSWRIFDKDGNTRTIEFKHDPHVKPKDEAIPKMVNDILRNESRVSLQLALLNYKSIFEILGNDLL